MDPGGQSVSILMRLSPGLLRIGAPIASAYCAEAGIDGRRAVDLESLRHLPLP